MSTITHSYVSMRKDPFSNMTVKVEAGQVTIAVHTYEHSVDVRLSREEAKRFAEHLLKELQ